MSNFTARIANLQDPQLAPSAIGKLHLMEASAGTGKTFSIQTIYLRLILIEGLRVQQILTVTFTKDATKELQDRLQKILRDALDYLDGTKTDVEDRTRMIVDLGCGTDQSDHKNTRDRLRLALLDFDMAAIYTIHGFCQRVLKRFAFETHQGFDIEPANNADEEIALLCRDWWRRNLYNMDPEMAGFLAENGTFTLKAITELARKLIAKPDAILADYQSNGLPDASLETMLQHKLTAARETLHVPQTQQDLPPSIQTAIKPFLHTIQQCSDAIDSQHWGDAITHVNALASMQTQVENPGMACGNELKTACQALKDIISGKTRKFTFDSDGSLSHPDVPNLAPDHTQAIAEIIQTLISTIESIDQVLGENTCINRKPTKAFEAILALHEHMQGKEMLEADAVAATVKKIAGGSLGLANAITITPHSLIPSFSDLMESFISAPVLDAALAIRKQYQDTRAAARTASFNDYLVNLREALNQNENLVDILRKEFQAALIDEFQDTDPIQWGIFQNLFEDAGIPCFLVGDPKQAIYRFRNGDVETYFKATQSVSAKYPLSTNYRSEKRLIDAVNQIFRDRPDHHTFGEQIKYIPSQAPDKKKGSTLCINGKPDAQPFKIMLLDKQNKPRNLQQAAQCTAQEIARLLLDPNTVIRDDDGIETRLEAKDIAVLVRKHDEGQAIAEALKECNIPSVRQGTGDVWQTDEGHNLWMMLEVILDPRNPNKVRAALISDWGGISLEQIQQLNEGHTITPPYGDEGNVTMEHFVARFVTLNEVWQQRGYPAMFRTLIQDLALKQRLLSQPDRQGQRRLANIAHLSELVERKIIEDRKTPESVLAWIRRQFSSDTADKSEDATLRLETDDNAVKIMTIFTCKGLQFPIVLAPTLFMMDISQRGDLYEYHDQEGNLVIVQKPDDKNRREWHKQREKQEMEQEIIRQMYVALTRAIHRTVVIAYNNAAKDGRPRKGEPQQFKPMGILGTLLRLPLKPENDGAVVDIDQAAVRFETEGDTSAIAISIADDSPEIVTMPASESAAALLPPPAHPAIDTTRGHGSFSSITPHTSEMPQTAPDATEVEAKDADAGTQSTEEEILPAKPTGIFAFPSGAHTGTCWHELFEDLDFAAADDVTIQEIVEQKLATYGFLKQSAFKVDRIKVTTDMVKNVMRCPLPNPASTRDAEPFTFSEITSANRKNEWAFDFSTRPNQTTAQLKIAIARYPQYESFVHELDTWNQPIPGGYLTGFVDLLFRHHDRYFITDWKSNRRNGMQDAFTTDGLRQEMSTHRYWLQYLIYTVAVHQYLSQALPDYSYEKHFGGVYYVFLRGVDGEQTNGHTNGIYYDLPPLELINDLSNILGDFT